MAAGNLGHRCDVAPVGLALDGDDIAELHAAQCGRGRQERQRALAPPESRNERPAQILRTGSPRLPGKYEVPPARFERTAPGLGRVCGAFCSVLLDATRATFHECDPRSVMLAEARFCRRGSNLVAGS
jgi:hypothetical protein